MTFFNHIFSEYSKICLVYALNFYKKCLWMQDMWSINGLKFVLELVLDFYLQLGILKNLVHKYF